MSGLSVAVVGVLIFGALTFLNSGAGRSWLYPGVAFSGIWALVFLAMCFAQSWLYSVSWVALGIFVVGASYFSFGAFVGSRIGTAPIEGTYPATTAGTQRSSDALLLILILIILAAGLPSYLQYLSTFTDAKPFSPLFFLQVRQGLIEESASESHGPIVENLVVLSTSGALIAYAITDAGRRLKLLVWSLIGFALLYNLLMASKVGLINLTISLVAIHGIRRGRIPVRVLAGAGVVVLVAFGAITVLRSTAATGGQTSIVDAAILTSKMFLNYFTTSAVAFSIYLRGGHDIEAVWSPWRFFERSANYFGHYFDVPAIHAHYAEVGPGLYYNTYSIYFSYYPEYGLIGVCLFMLFLGVIGGYAFRRARAGSLQWTLFYSFLFYGFLISFFNESLFTALNPIIKLLALGALFAALRKVQVMRLPVKQASAAN